MDIRKILPKNKKGAIELSIGTVVIIVLAMSMLILGIVLIRNIFSTATSSITEIDQGVKNEINRLFSENQEKTLILYPDSGVIQVVRGSGGSGFALSIHNTNDDNEDTFDYTVTVIDFSDCPRNPLGDTVTMIGATEPGIKVPAESLLENPRHVRFTVSENAPICTFRVKAEVTGCMHNNCPKDGTMDIEIVPS